MCTPFSIPVIYFFVSSACDVACRLRILSNAKSKVSRDRSLMISRVLVKALKWNPDTAVKESIGNYIISLQTSIFRRQYFSFMLRTVWPEPYTRGIRCVHVISIKHLCDICYSRFYMRSVQIGRMAYVESWLIFCGTVLLGQMHMTKQKKIANRLS